MKKALILLAAILIGHYSNAQYALAKGDKQVNAGVGLSTWGIPVYVGLDFGVDTDISAGAEISYRNNTYRYFGDRYRRSVIGISGNANYHFNGIADIPTQYDFYAGLNVGFFIWGDAVAGYGGRTSGLGLAAQVGGRYYFNSTTAVNLEFSGGSVFGTKLGLSAKF